MLERKRKARGYGLVTGDADLDDAERDVELGEGINGQESGIVHHETAPKAVSLEQELDNWDENAPDDEWNETDQQANAAATADGVKPSMSPKPVDGEDTKKRAD